MLLGEYSLTMDDGRLVLPEHVREVLRDMYDDETLIVTNFFEDCLVLYPVAVWPGEQEWLQREGASPEMMQCFWDSGVVLGERIPSEYLQYAGIVRDVFLIGMVRKYELWALDRWIRAEFAP